MRRIRVIPTLLVRNQGLIKTIQFNKETYVGDRINTVRIFNEKEVDELIVLDVEASITGRSPDFDLVTQLATECFMPFGYGGGIRTMEQITQLLRIGAEKICLNTAAAETPELVRVAADHFGSQAIVVSIDVKKTFWRQNQVWIRRAKKSTGRDPVEYAQAMQKLGAGEILLCSVDREGTFLGYDLDLIRKVVNTVSIPVIACGGAKNVDDFRRAAEAGASAVAAGSCFVFHGVHRAVLIQYPTQSELRNRLYQHL